MFHNNAGFKMYVHYNNFMTHHYSNYCLETDEIVKNFIKLPGNMSKDIKANFM